MSGGVDSATTAALLVERGHRVVGLTMRLYDARGTAASIGGRCCGPRDIEDARRVCAELDIPFYVVDYEREFERRVVDDFVASYLAGETPNPCARCNEHIKFTPLLRRARALGCDALATGHYARLEPDGDGWALRRGVDPGKDQSYFLFAMPASALGAVRFPLGGLTKDEVRAEARRLGVPVADKPDSQEICFVPDGDYAGFVERRARAAGRPLPRAGDVVDRTGRVVGRHAGVHRYTLGQRRGLGAIGRGQPAYVVDLDAATNRVVVGPREAAARSTLRVRDVNWLAPRPAAPVDVLVQVRHRQTPRPARVSPDGGGARVDLAEPLVAAPGQAAVFYAGDRVLGGGWIAPAAERAAENLAAPAAPG
ncbi:MAG: tRNA 2-thiouridine(34) synthase MnmA [Deltaproteobacteria bacterium]|nr:MAG: tRNA 2-thiouridine(34) synthase MnmA [Deltaproteobacteria bacterium]